ncbi:MAG TPA: HlyD family efflux transporter periplasmic adaptor subunit, partial [Gammaproteobacteria bacterium]|nr:HlyD family efflux transporter periplasmic adaptor subunit [Gammaproteobacteria bacterium]
ENKHTLSAMLEVRAPMAGVILAQLATPGQRVDIASPIYRIGELDPLWLEIQVPLEKLAGVKPGTDVKVAKPEARGKVVTIGSMIQGENQSILVRAEIPNDQGHLRPGQFVEARLAQVGGQRVWRIPRQALLRVGGKTWVLVERDKGFEPVAVSLIGEEHDTLVIKGELQSGDHVAVSGTAALKAAWLEGEG